MNFSEYFGISKDKIENYGALDISIICDIPLFIDLMSIFNSDKVEYKELHEEIIDYFYFLAKKAKEGLEFDEVWTWFRFSEIPNN